MEKITQKKWITVIWILFLSTNFLGLALWADPFLENLVQKWQAAEAKITTICSDLTVNMSVNGISNSSTLSLRYLKDVTEYAETRTMLQGTEIRSIMKGNTLFTKYGTQDWQEMAVEGSGESINPLTNMVSLFSDPELIFLKETGTTRVYVKTLFQDQKKYTAKFFFNSENKQLEKSEVFDDKGLLLNTTQFFIKQVNGIDFPYKTIITTYGSQNSIISIIANEFSKIILNAVLPVSSFDPH